MTETNTSTDRTSITVTYCGRRLDHHNKLIQELQHEGRSLLYSKIKHGVIGGRYTVDAVQDDTRMTIYPSTMRYAGEKVDDVDQVAAWEALDRDAWETTRYLALERKHQANTALDEYVAQGHSIVRQAKSTAEARAIVKIISNKLLEGWWNQPA